MTPTTTPGSTSASAGLFESLVGDPIVLFSGVLDNPDTYEDGVSELLQELVYKKRPVAELSLEERALLDRAAIDFASAKRPRPPPRVKPRPSPVRSSLPAPARAACGEEGSNDDRPPIEIPDAPPTFWWRDKKG